MLLVRRERNRRRSVWVLFLQVRYHLKAPSGSNDPGREIRKLSSRSFLQQTKPQERLRLKHVGKPEEG